ncbi:MAG: hypothetical protein A2452_02725 [Candidatus Firestonebacteria bacterium RIFOXYC2_FULL_39_67]|nr:MAG: hypothetical protein A2536_02140 [Candidatus Firestonebacteria bacterium RIFOXYD2_FULL_39_29]OGF55374.1 MAG: hypothetical protein A2452_02725 [Candidatus Firestonebacteria bacterium RIFOXYC2_FULL_39_67]OGF56747.1 MAG: hypothetical protein A2497_06600 [Candidatus Firestonebacteria bacterium RifOxyC12_full_39_7]
MNILDPKKIKIEKDLKGSLVLNAGDGKKYQRVSFILLFPFTDTENYISAVIKNGAEYNEIGIIEHIKDLPGKIRGFVKEDLKLRYFVPEIRDIRSIATKYWFHEFDVITDRGEKKFYLRNVREGVRFKTDSSIVITDMEKNRYKIPDYRRLSSKARTELDRILL